MTATYLYVPNEADKTVSVVNTSNNSVVATIPVAATPDGTAVSPDGTIVYVASESGFVSVIDTASNTVTGTIPVGSGADFVAFSPDGGLAYVTHYGGNYVTVINTASNTVVTDITTGAGTYSVAVTPDGSRAYVTNESAGTVSVVDSASNTVVASITVGRSPTVVAVSPDGIHVYVSNYGDGTLSVIDRASNSVTATINVGGDPYSVVVSPDGSHAYVATGSAISIIDTSNNSISNTLSFGSGTLGLAISPDGKHLYVSDLYGSSGVSVIDLATNTLDGTIAVGRAPEYLAIGSIPSPPAPQLALAVDSGSSNSDAVTNVGVVAVKGLQSGATWQYSTDAGKTWITGSGASFALTGDGSKSVLVHQTNAADITSSNSNLTFLLDTTAPGVTEILKNDTGSSASDHITKDATLTGSGDPNAVVALTIDGGSAVTTTADGAGKWSYAPTGLSDGSHSFVASETDAAGNSGTASLSFNLDATAPIPSITNEVLSTGKVTLTGTTGEANDSVAVYEGSTLLGTTKTGGDGTWNFVTGPVSNAVHTYTVSATDPAGNIGVGSNDAILGTTKADTLVGTSGNDFIVGNGGNDNFTGGAGADRLVAGSGNDHFIFKAISDSTPASHDTIINFDHVHDVFDFSGITGINSSKGNALFQGQLTGSGNLTLNAHSVGYLEVGGHTEVLVNTTNSRETVSASDARAANMEIDLNGTNLGLTNTDFHWLI